MSSPAFVSPPRLPRVVLEPIVRTALLEDFGLSGDRTAQLIAADRSFSAAIVARKGGVIAGLDAARLTCQLVDEALVFDAQCADGDALPAAGLVARISGPARSVLAAERTMLNFLTHLSGIATLTRAFVDAVAGTKARIAATRKTLPGLRAMQKHAVQAGGGWPHRYALSDAILIKDNHIAAAGSIRAAIGQARTQAGHLCAIEIEIDALSQLDEALAGRPDVIMLDNFGLDDMAAAVVHVGGRVTLEASGGVTLKSVQAIARTGVDVISVGALTHSAPALDLGLDAS